MSAKQDDNQNIERQERNRDERSGESRAIRQRPLKPTPQNLQRINYTRQANSQSTPTRSFRTPTPESACTKCSLIHQSGSCPAYGQQCRRARSCGALRERMSVSAQQLGRRAQYSSDGEVGNRGHYPLAAARAPNSSRVYDTTG
jgi:hypothetical protein